MGLATKIGTGRNDNSGVENNGHDMGSRTFSGTSLAVNNMAGGKASDVLQPVMELVTGLMSMLVNLFIQVLRIGICRWKFIKDGSTIER